MGQAQQPRHRVGGRHALLEVERSLTELVQELPRLDAEVLVAVSGPSIYHAHLRLHEAKQIFESNASCDAVCCVWPELASVSFDAWATFPIATFTCSTAVICCLVDSSISRAASVVRGDQVGDLLERRGHVAELPGAGVHRLGAGLGGHDRRVDGAPNVVDEARISFVEPATRSASFLISSATTANRLPASPAPAASMVALMARMLVCSASSDTISSTAPICCDFLPSSSMWLTIRSTWRRIPAIDSCAVSTVSSPRSRRGRRLLGDLGDPLRALGDLA